MRATNDAARQGPLILVVDDDTALAETIAEALADRGFRVRLAHDRAAAARALAEARPSLVLLDVMLPDADGLAYCADLASSSGVPIIVMSATSRHRDATLSLRLGADAFLSKPLDLESLPDRVATVLQRRHPEHPAAPTRAATPPAPRQVWRVGALEVDASRRRVAVGGTPIPLTPQELRVLAILAERPDEVIEKDALARALWGDTDKHRRRHIDVIVRGIRAKLAAAVPCPTIRGVRGFGLMLSADVSE